MQDHLLNQYAVAAQAEMDANGLSADIPQATALVSFMQLLGKRSPVPGHSVLAAEVYPVLTR